MFAALLDTSVLWPSLLRDFLLSLAIERMYRPLWSIAILAELVYAESRKLMDRGEQPDVAAARAGHLIDQMTAAFDDALVENWEPVEGTFGLPDPDDEHVVAAAVVGGAGAIVTENLRDFPLAKIPPHIKLLSSAEFAADPVSVSPDVALRAVQTMAARYAAPALTTDDILNRLVQRYELTEAVELIRTVN
ncbi:PIN domain-containing protein [Mycobacterium sp.]|uniref:PIN domain-containing protein n=1 Tax=Mycobacterium sp. TaxID=1785 RepID=UPI002CCE9069|nr:PIN domain-containing protein [Mycobacterium sp.]HTY31266.1 PIN domain-containing protein [Mycobacterium sp.]